MDDAAHLAADRGFGLKALSARGVERHGPNKQVQHSLLLQDWRCNFRRQAERLHEADRSMKLLRGSCGGKAPNQDIQNLTGAGIVTPFAILPRAGVTQAALSCGIR